MGKGGRTDPRRGGVEGAGRAKPVQQVSTIDADFFNHQTREVVAQCRADSVGRLEQGAADRLLVLRDEVRDEHVADAHDAAESALQAGGGG